MGGAGGSVLPHRGPAKSHPVASIALREKARILPAAAEALPVFLRGCFSNLCFREFGALVS